MKMRYIVKKEDGVVICLGEDAAFDFCKDLGILNKNTDLGDVKFTEVIPFLISDTFKGIARLADDDTWDEQIGKDVARAKMFTKYNNAKAKKANALLASLVNSAEYLSDLLDTYTD